MSRRKVRAMSIEAYEIERADFQRVIDGVRRIQAAAEAELQSLDWLVGVIREVLMRVDPEELDRALGGWNALWATRDRSLAIDGKTLRGASDEQGNQVHVMSAVGHESKAAYTQKKSPA